MNNYNIDRLDNEIIQNNNSVEFLSRVISSGASFYHTHSYYEIFYVLSGTVEHYFNGRKETLSPGDLYILAPGDVHNFLGGTDVEYSHRDIMLSCRLWEIMCENLHINLFDVLLPSQQKIHLSPDGIRSLETSISHFFQFRQKNPNAEEKPFVYIVLSDIIKRYLFKYSSNEAQEDAHVPLWLTKLINQLSLPENITKDKREILSTLHYSQEHVCRVFKQHMHETITDYINNKRLDLAASMFCSTTKTVRQICKDCGFESTAYFSKLFQKRFGVVPSKFRSQSQE